MHPSLHSLFTPWSWTTLDLLNHLWQSTAVGLAVLILLGACGRLSAGTRRALGWMAVAKFALPMAPLVRLIATIGGTPNRWLESRAMTLPANWSTGMFVTAPSPAGVTAPGPNLAGLLIAAVWLAGGGALLISWIVRGVRLRRRILAEATPATEAMQRAIAAAAARAGLDEVPRCLTVENDHGPGVLGVLSPIVILPRGLEETLASAELEAILIHEFVHLRRRDNLWAAGQTLFVSLLWFDPVVWLLNDRIKVETEKSCDERVLEITRDPDTYAGGIVKSVRHAMGVARPGLAGATTPPVVSRIKNILAHGQRPDRPLARGAALVTGGLLVALSGYAGSFTAADLTKAPVRVVALNAALPPAALPATGGAADETSAAQNPGNVATAGKKAAADNATLSIDFPDEDIRNIIKNVAHLFELNVVMPDTLQGKTTIKLRDVTWRQIYQGVLEPVGYTFVEDGNVVRIVARETSGGEPTTSVVFALIHVRAQDILPTISALVDPTNGKIVVDNRSNSLVITERSSRMNRIRPVIEQLDRAPDSRLTAPAAESPAPAAVAPASPAAAPTLMPFAAPPQPQTQPESSPAPTGPVKEVVAVPAGGPMPAPVAATSDAGSAEPLTPAPPTAKDIKLRGIRVYDPSQLDQQPIPKFQARPQYPLALRRSGIGGEATVDFIIDTNGDVQNAYAIHSTYREFAISAVAAVSQWKFRPGRKGGQNVPTHLQVPIVFSLNEH